jgi:hypothetical protein
MRRVRFASSLLPILLAAACGREHPQPVKPSTSASAPTSTASAPTKVPPPPPRTTRIRSTPERCGGDGTYPAAIDCFRQTAGYHFTLAAGAPRAEGDMARTAVGAESVRFHLTGAGADDGDWIASSKGMTIAWFHDGKRVTAEPAIADTIYQRTTLTFDPQKREGDAQLTGTEMVAGIDSNRYHFTDANNGDGYDVWVGRASGDIVKLRVAPSSQFRTARSELTMTLANHGHRVAIEAPK